MREYDAQPEERGAGIEWNLDRRRELEDASESGRLPHESGDR
jgi:hypothetical protein